MCEGFASVFCRMQEKENGEDGGEKGERKGRERREKERERCAHVYAVTRVYIDDGPATDPVKDPGGEREERDNARRRLVVGVVWMQ